MKVSPVSYNLPAFKAQNAGQNRRSADENPVSSAGEKAVLMKAGFIAGLGFGGKLLFELMDGDFVSEYFSKTADKIVKKQKNLTPMKRVLKETAVFTGLCGLFVSGAALLYTIFKAPEINYQGNVNAFKNKKDMDVYIKGSNIEKELYTQMNEKALKGSREDREKLRTQYFQMKAAKNQVPDFVYRQQH